MQIQAWESSSSSQADLPSTLSLKLWCLLKWGVKVLDIQSCPTLCSPMECSPPGCSVHGVPQARMLAWVAIPFFRGYLLSFSIKWPLLRLLQKWLFLSFSLPELKRSQPLRDTSQDRGCFWSTFLGLSPRLDR